MDLQLIEYLLNESESAQLDFKQEQYPFVNTSDQQKSELLKDILAFANAWKRSDAYILIGVEEVIGGRGNILGVSQHLKDADLQQFVGSKTTRPVTFSYSAVPIDGKQIGVIHIPIQERPILLNKDYGKLKKGIVYIRRSSSTGEATLEETIRMVSNASQDKPLEPVFDLQFADADKHILLGTSVTLDLTAVNIPDPKDIPSASGSHLMISLINKDYYRELANCVFMHTALKPIRFYLQNIGNQLAQNVKMEMEISKIDGLYIKDESAMPSMPSYNVMPKLSRSTSQLPRSSGITVRDRGDRWIVEIEFGDIHAKRSVWVEDKLYVAYNGQKTFDAVLFANNLGEPQKIPLTIDFKISETMNVTVNQLFNFP